MGDFLNDTQCVTHHYACECRERGIAEEISRLRSEVKRLTDALRQIRKHQEYIGGNMASYGATLTIIDSVLSSIHNEEE